MAHSKYIAMYNGMPMPFDDLKEFAVKVMGFRVVQNDRGTWDVIVNGEKAAGYTDEWTRQEVEDDYLKSSFFGKFTRPNLAFYKLV